MRPRGLVVLAIVAAAMGAFIVIDRWRGADERASAPARLLPAFDRQAVKRITIRRAGRAFSLLHAPSPAAPAPAPGWQLEIAGAPAADNATIDDLLSALDLAESDRTAKLSPEQAGLAPAAAEIVLETPSGTPALQLGKTDATGQGVYARAGAGGPIRVIGRRLLDLVDRDPAAFRDRRLFPVDPAAVSSIAWRDGAGAGELRAVEGRWQNGRKEWLAPERIAESLRRLLALRIDRFDVDTGAGNESAGTRTLTLTAGDVRIPLTGGANGIVTRGNERLQVPADALEAARRSLVAAAVRDDRLLSQEPDGVTSVVLSDERARLHLERQRGAWTFVAPKVPYAADTRVVDDWLARLHETKAPPAGPAGPRARTLTVAGRFPERVDVSSPEDARALLAADPLRFRERAVLSFARFDVRRLARTEGARSQQLTTDDGGSWRAASGEVDAANAAVVAGTLGNLRAEDFVASAPTGVPAVRWEVDVQAPGEARSTRHAVEVWTRKDGDCVARLDAATAFTLERATCATLRVALLKVGPSP